MTANNQQESHTPPGQRTVDQRAATQVGQIVQSLGALQERLNMPRPRSRRAPRHYTAASREQIASLISALGDPQHPDHARAVDTLVDIGPAAVPLLTDALDQRLPWLTSYRAAEALGYIGDGSATGDLIQALRHPNTNVRWSAIRALAQIGDLRAVLALRQMAHDDHGRTSWGESLSGTAQSALDQLRARSMWNQGIELVKTAITSVLMILALVLAVSVVTNLRDELQRISNPDPAASFQPALPAPQAPAAPVEPEAPIAATPPTATPEPEPTIPQNTPTPDLANAPTGTALQGSNVRPSPSTENEPIGQLSLGDQVIFRGVSPDGEWYLIQLGENYSDISRIDDPDGTGWVNSALLSAPAADLPVVEPDTPTPTATTSPEI
jgi:hypothetical protein